MDLGVWTLVLLLSCHMQGHGHISYHPYPHPQLLHLLHRDVWCIEPHFKVPSYFPVICCDTKSHTKSWSLKLAVYCYHTCFLGVTGLSWMAFICQTVAGAARLWRRNWSYIQDSLSAPVWQVTWVVSPSSASYGGLAISLDCPWDQAFQEVEMPGKLRVELLLPCRSTDQLRAHSDERR